MTDIWSTQGSTVSAGIPFLGASGAGVPPPPPRTMSLSHLPTPIFPTPPRAFTHTPMDVEATVPKYPTEFSPSFSYGQSVQSNSTLGTRNTSSCCSIDEGKTELRKLISDFQMNLDDILTKTFGPQHGVSSQNTQADLTVPPTPPIQPFWLLPVFCTSCNKNVAALRQFTCENCFRIFVSW
jgi:hypothetical protein